MLLNNATSLYDDLDYRHKGSEAFYGRPTRFLHQPLQGKLYLKVKFLGQCIKGVEEFPTLFAYLDINEYPFYEICQKAIYRLPTYENEVKVRFHELHSNTFQM